MPTTVELRPVAPTRLDAALPRLRSFVSPLTGVVSGLAETLAATDEHRLVSIGCEVADGVPTIGSRLDSYTGSEHPIREAAEAAAIGEALERYSGSFVPGERLVVASADQLGPSAVDPERFALFSAAQHAVAGFPFAPFRRDTVVSWVDGFAVPSGEHAYLPAQLVFMPWRDAVAGETRIGHTTSSGLACAPTLEEAVLTGLFELIERDAFMLVWHNRLSLPRLDWRDDAIIERLDSRYLRAFRSPVLGDRPERLLRRADCPRRRPWQRRGSSARSASVPRAQRPPRSPGGRLLPRRSPCSGGSATRHSSSRNGSAARPRRSRRSTPTRSTTLVEKRARRAAFLDASPERRHTSSIAPLGGANVLELVEGLARRLAARGCSAYAVDVTSPDVRAAGLRVVRVVAPELCALDVVEGARFLGGRRMYEAAFRAGLVPSARPSDLNPDPHPFP